MWETYDSMFRWLINESAAFVLYRAEAFFVTVCQGTDWVTVAFLHK